MPAMTDDDGDILAHYRVRYPYISTKQAKELHRIEAKFGLGRMNEKSERPAAEQARREVRERLFDVRDGDH